MPRRSTVHPSDISSQLSNGNGRRRPSYKNPFFSRMFRNTVHPNIPISNIENPIENPIIENPIIENPIIENPIIEIANRWIENPLIDPYNNKDISLSIYPESKYVILYKKIMNALINDIRGAFPQGYVLTIDDCKYIKNNLPIIHSIIDIPGDKYIKYDHLFTKYFVTKIREYNKSYCEDSEIKLYLNIYNAIIRKIPTIKRETEKQSSKSQSSKSQSSKSQSFAKDNYVLIEDLLKNNMNLSKTDLSISKLVINMCIDVKYILYMYEPMITLENYKIALHNKKTLEYVASLYKAGFVTGIINDELYDKDGFVHYKNMLKSITDQILSPHNKEDIIEIYSKIINKIGINTKIEKKNMDDNNILNKLIAIYDIILSLYARFFNKQIDPSKFIKKNSQGSRKSGSQGSRKSGSKSSSKEEVIKLNPYCEKDVVDPITQDPIHELGEKDRKYVVSILSYNKDAKKVNYYCFDTIEIYNYILNCIQNIKKIKNPFFTNINFTDDDLDEICNKIKFLTDFTQQPTYNSHVDIKEAYYESIVNNIKLINVQLNILEENFKKLGGELHRLYGELHRLNGELHSKENLLLMELQFKEIKYLKKGIENLKIEIENLKKGIEKLEIEIINIQIENYSLSLEKIRLGQEESKFDEKYKKKDEYNNYLKISFGYEYNLEEYKRVDIIGIYDCFLTINLANIQLPIINIIRLDEEHSNKIFKKDIPYIKNKDNSFLVNFPIFKDPIKNNVVMNGIEILNDYIAKIGENDISFPYKRKIFNKYASLKKIAHLPPFHFGMKEKANDVIIRFQKYIRRITDIQKKKEK
jgi:hypothetical protein